MGGTGGIVTLIYLAIIIFLIASFWKVFTKAGQPGWASIIPITTLLLCSRSSAGRGGGSCCC